MAGTRLTATQEKVLRWIVNYIRENDRPPTIRDLAEAFRYTVKGAYDHLRAIERKGWIERQEKHARGIVVKQYPPGMEHIGGRRQARAIPLVGRIAAGGPDAAIPEVDDWFVIHEGLLGRGEHYALRVRGDSMKDAGIFDGDIVIVRKQNHAEHGDIVVALLDNIETEATLKRFVMNKGRIVLQAENPDYEDIEVRDIRRLHIDGVVVGLYRSIR